MPMATSRVQDEDTSGKLPTSIKLKLIWKTEDVGGSKPSSREGHCSCVLGENLYIFGGVSMSGSDDVQEKDDLWKFNMGNRKWTLVKCAAGSERPLSRSAATMVSVGTKLYLFGGLNHSVGWLDDLLIFDTETNSWREEDEFSGSPPSARDKLCSAVIGQNIWFFGGFGPQVENRGPLDVEDEEDLSSDDEIQRLERQQQAAQFGWFDDLHVYNTQTKTWSQPLQMSMGKPSPRCAATMIAHKNTLIIFGGRDADGRLNDIHFFDTDSRKWVKDRKVKGEAPECRSFHAATLVDSDTMLVAGGRGVDNQHFNDVYSLSIGKSCWAKLDSSGTTGRGCHSLCSLEGRVLMFGGSSTFNQNLQHCETFHGDLLISSYNSIQDKGEGGSPSKQRRVE